MKLDRTADTPLYIQIYESFRRDILFGRLNNGDRLPAVRALASQTGVSASTVKRAYELLCENGFISCTGREYKVIFAARQ